MTAGIVRLICERGEPRRSIDTSECRVLDLPISAVGLADKVAEGLREQGWSIHRELL